MPDASESPWLYLFFLVILVVEQAMAVHLSFHLRGNEVLPERRPARTGCGVKMFSDASQKRPTLLRSVAKP